MVEELAACAGFTCPLIAIVAQEIGSTVVDVRESLSWGADRGRVAGPVVLTLRGTEHKAPCAEKRTRCLEINQLGVG